MKKGAGYKTSLNRKHKDVAMQRTMGLGYENCTKRNKENNLRRLSKYQNHINIKTLKP
jgi:hypothetical protein